ncbi:MAG: ribosome assembly RNA-binding protein YhbY [Betaproteobacteria bacterium]|nr:ribosome assembly RNA-binding protein YhbY [Betaproteobacteria bacterium]
MSTLSPARRRALRARAHHLRPVVIVGGNRVTDAVVAEVEVHLKAHELIKVKVAGEERDAREAMLAELCRRTGSAPVQHIGKTLVLYREHPVPAEEPAPAPKPRAARAPRGAKPDTRRRRATPSRRRR